MRTNFNLFVLTTTIKPSRISFKTSVFYGYNDFKVSNKGIIRWLIVLSGMQRVFGIVGFYLETIIIMPGIKYWSCMDINSTNTYSSPPQMRKRNIIHASLWRLKTTFQQLVSLATFLDNVHFCSRLKANLTITRVEEYSAQYNSQSQWPTSTDTKLVQLKSKYII